MDGEATRLEPVRLRPTRRMLVVPPLGLLLFAAGQNVGAGYLLVLAGALIASAPWGWWTARRASRTVDVRREVPARARVGAPVSVTLHLEAHATGAIVLRDELTGVVGVVEDPRRGGEVTAEVGLRRGAAAGGDVTAEVADPLGLFTGTVTGYVPSRVEVLPAVERAEVSSLVDVAGQRADRDRRLAGDGSQTDGTREYRQGDPVRAVHWRSSARRDELVVRRLVGEAAGRVRFTVERGAWQAPALDRACIALAAGAEGAAERGIEVDLVVGGLVLPWTRSDGRRVLAHLRPNLGDERGDGAPDREAPGLAVARDVADVGPAHVGVVFAPRGEHAVVRIEVDGSRRDLGLLPVVDDVDVLRRWVADHLGAGSPVSAGAEVPA